MSTKKLQIVTPIVTSVNGETGDVTLNSIEYTPQTLTDAQKAQARENIGAQDIQVGSVYYLWESNHANDIFSIYDTGAKIGIVTGEAAVDSDGNQVKVPLMVVFGSVEKGYVSAVATSAEGKMYALTLNLSTCNRPTLYKIKNITLNDDDTLSQQIMSAAPTTDMQIATKKYVDDGLVGKADSSHNHSASNITSGTLPITRGGTNASTAAAARTNLGFSYGTSVPTSAPDTGNGAVFFCQDSGVPLSIANGGTGGATQDAARTNLGLPTQDNRIVTICNGTRLVSGSNITITLDPTEAKKYRAILILLGTPLGGNYGNMYDSFTFPLNPDTWSFRFFNYTSEGQDWQCAKANLSSDWTTFTITAVSGSTNHPCWCYLM